MVCIGEHEGIIWDMAYNTDHSALITGSSDGMVKVWSLSAKQGRTVVDSTQPIVLSSNHDDIYSITVRLSPLADE